VHYEEIAWDIDALSGNHPNTKTNMRKNNTASNANNNSIIQQDNATKWEDCMDQLTQYGSTQEA
jgi:hypothetical protein